MSKEYPNSSRKKYSVANRCAVCRHPERVRIEALHVAGTSLDKLAKMFGVHRDAVWRHMARHVSEDRKVGYLVEAGKLQTLAELAANENRAVIDYFGIVRSILVAQLDQAASRADATTVNQTAAQLTSVLEKIARLTGQIGGFAKATVVNIRQNVTILNSAPFADLQACLLQLCAAHPEVRGDVIALFKNLDLKYAPSQGVCPPVVDTS